MDWEYKIIEDGTEVKLTRYTGNSPSVVTPETINGLPVTVLGNCAFLNNPQIRTVCLSDSIHTVENGSGIWGTGAFRNCKQLHTVVLSGQMNRIADYMFYGTAYGQSTKLSVDFRNVTQIGDFAFACCNHIVKLTLPESVCKIGTAAFYQARRLAELEMPGVSEIAADAFTETIFEERYEDRWKRGMFSGIVYADKVAYIYMGTPVQPMDIAIKDGTLGISEFLFDNHYTDLNVWKQYLRKLSIPKSVRFIPPDIMETFLK